MESDANPCCLTSESVLFTLVISRLAELFQVPYTLTKVKGQDWLDVCCRSFGLIWEFETADPVNLTVVKSSLSLGKKIMITLKFHPTLQWYLLLITFNITFSWKHNWIWFNFIYYTLSLAIYSCQIKKKL